MQISRLAASTVTAAEPVGTDRPRVLEARLVAWDTPGEVSDDGRTTYTEVWRRGSIIPTDSVMPVYAGHSPTAAGIARGPLIGRIDQVADHDDGLYAELVLMGTPTAFEVWEAARVVGATVSLEADADQTADPGQTLVRSPAAPATLTGAAVLTLPARGAFPGAAVLAARSHPDNGGTMAATLTDDPTVPIDPDPRPGDPVPRPADPDDPDDPDEDRMTIGRGQLEETIRRELVRARLPRGGVPAHPLARFTSLSSFADAAYNAGSIRQYVTGGGERPLGAQIARAWVNQLTTENPGVIPPGWLNDVYGIVDHSRPLISAIGTRALPESGMDVNWPYFDGDLSTLVGEQTAEKTEITSVKVSLKRGTAPITTFAGGSDISYQLIRRSSPSYRDAYLRIMNASYALVTDRAASIDLVDLATGFQQVTAGATIDEFRAAIFAASVKVEAATGSPASVVALSTDLFIKFGSALLPGAYGTMNQSGTADASTLNVNVSGLRVVHARYLATGTGVVTNGQAAAWAEDGPFVISAPDVPKLGEDTAIWGMGALEVTAPAGVIILAAVAPTATESGRSSAKKSAA